MLHTEEVLTLPCAAGDFNGSSKEGVYRLLYRGRLEGGYTESYSDEAILPETYAHPYKLQDVYASCASFRMPFTRAVPGFACTIDFLWSTENMGVASVLQCASGGRAQKLMLTGLPSKDHPSDHLPLGLVLNMLPTAGMAAKE